MCLQRENGIDFARILLDVTEELPRRTIKIEKYTSLEGLCRDWNAYEARTLDYGADLKNTLFRESAQAVDQLYSLGT